MKTHLIRNEILWSIILFPKLEVRDFQESSQILHFSTMSLRIVLFYTFHDTLEHLVQNFS